LVVATQGAMLVTRIGSVACALPIELVVETMRALPIEPIGASDDALALVDGLAMIRGSPVPVVDARRLLGVTGGGATRFVVVRIADRRLALVVDSVIEVKRLDLDALARLPPLLDGSRSAWASAIGARDAGLLIVLDAARVLPESSWRALDQRAGRSADP
jgi:purine-binding chemotaxis protein CheW